MCLKPGRRTRTGVPKPGCRTRSRSRPNRRSPWTRSRPPMRPGVRPGIVLADAGYGVDGAFRAGVSALGLSYAVGVQSTVSVWPPGQEPLAPKPWSGRGRPPSLVRRDHNHRPVSAKALAASLAENAWTVVTWREGTNAPQGPAHAAPDAVAAVCHEWQRSARAPI